MNSIISKKILIHRKSTIIWHSRCIKSTNRVLQRIGTVLHHGLVPGVTASMNAVPLLKLQINHFGNLLLLLDHAVLNRSPGALFHAGLVPDDPGIGRLVSLVF